MDSEYSVTYTGFVQQHPIYAIASAYVNVTLGNYAATNVDRYPFYMEPKAGYTWQDGTVTPRFVVWHITKANPTGALPSLTVEPYSETPYALTGGIYLMEGGNKTVYPTLPAAYNALPDSGGTIYIQGEVTVTSGLETVPGKLVKLLGKKGAVLARDGNFSTVTVTDGASLTVENLTMTSASGTAANGGAINVQGGSLTLADGVVLTGNKAPGYGRGLRAGKGRQRHRGRHSPFKTTLPPSAAASSWRTARQSPSPGV